MAALRVLGSLASTRPKYAVRTKTFSLRGRRRRCRASSLARRTGGDTPCTGAPIVVPGLGGRVRLELPRPDRAIHSARSALSASGTSPTGLGSVSRCLWAKLSLSQVTGSGRSPGGTTRTRDRLRPDAGEARASLARPTPEAGGWPPGDTQTATLGSRNRRHCRVGIVAAPSLPPGELELAGQPPGVRRAGPPGRHRPGFTRTPRPGSARVPTQAAVALS